MNADKIVLKFDLEEMYLEVINNKFLPFELKDYIKTTEPTFAGIKKTAKDIEVLKDFFVSRTLNLSRENAKIILNVAALPQSLKTKERLEIVFACKGLTMTDNFWIKKENENLKFSEVNLRKNPLGEASYDIAILGKYISATRDELCSDLSTGGMFPKYWHRKNNEIFLYKTDKFINNPTVYAEIKCCKYLEQLGINAIHYELLKKDNLYFSVSKCIATDKYSLISAQSVRDYCNHNNMNFQDYIESNFLEDFSNMCICDYIFGNTDRHFENWGFLVDNTSNEIVKFAPLYDHNQALLCDNFKTNINDLVYEPCNKKYIDSALKYYNTSTVDFSKITDLDSNCIERLNFLNNFQNEKETEYIQK